MSDVPLKNPPLMSELEADELAKFRDKIQNADLLDVLTVGASVIDSASELLGSLNAPESLLAQLVFIASELRVRRRWLERPSLALRADLRRRRKTFEHPAPVALRAGKVGKA